MGLVIDDFEAARHVGRHAPVGEMLGSAIAVLAGALLIWWLYPAGKIRRRALRPLPAAALPDLAAALRELCELAGIDRHPTFLWNPLELAPAAVAFGRLRRRYVGLSGGLVVQFGRDRPAFRAIVLHELAHLRNGDVAITYFAVAIWWSFVALALVPFLLLYVLRGIFQAVPFGLSPLAWVGTWSWRLAALSLLVYLTRSSFLRTREVYADIRASAWDGPAGALPRVLDRLPRPGLPAWLRPLAAHPDPSRRQRWLDHPDALFGLGFWEAFGTGAAVGVANTDIATMVIAWNPRAALTIPGIAASGLVVSLMGAGTVGLGLWRAALAAAARASAVRGTTAVGLGLGAGLVLGPALSLTTQALDLADRGRVAGLRPALPDVVLDVLVVCAVVLLVRWTAGTATAWLRPRPAGSPPRTACLVGVALTGCFLGGIVALSLAAGLLIGFDGAVGLVPLVVVTSPLAAVALTSLWAFPLAAEARGMRRELAIGLVAGLLFWPLYIGAFALLPHVVRGTGPVFSAVAAATAAVAAATSRPPSAPRGLLAALVSGCVTLPVWLALSQPASLPVAVLTASTWISLATLIACPFALLGAAAGRRRT